MIRVVQEAEKITLAERWSARGRSGGDAPSICSQSGTVLYLLVRK